MAFQNKQVCCKPTSRWFVLENWKIAAVFVQLLSRVWLFVTPWTTARQTPPSFIISQSLLKYMSIESLMLYNHLILCHPLLLLPLIFASIRVVSNESPVSLTASLSEDQELAHLSNHSAQANHLTPVGLKMRKLGFSPSRISLPILKFSGSQVISSLGLTNGYHLMKPSTQLLSLIWEFSSGKRCPLYWRLYHPW